jgi:hypothetical protein
VVHREIGEAREMGFTGRSGRSGRSERTVHREIGEIRENLSQAAWGDLPDLSELPVTISWSP